VASAAHRRNDPREMSSSEAEAEAGRLARPLHLATLHAADWEEVVIFLLPSRRMAVDVVAV
jgi:hypothetical protein